MALSDAAKEIDYALTRDGYKGMSYEAPFAGATSFMRRTYTKDLTGVDLAITGIPFDQAACHRPGTRFGPRAIREASTLQPCDPPYGWDINPFVEFNLADCGDLAYDYGNIAKFPLTLAQHVYGIISTGCGYLGLGGDHYITFPTLRAFAKQYGPMALIQFDAHTDTWPDNDMRRIDHGTMFYKAFKEGLIVPEKSVQIGIRTQNDYDAGCHVIDAPAVHGQSPDETVKQIKAIVGDHPVFLTFDIDCLDPAFAPGTGTPVWGGLSSAQAATILRGLRGINIKGGDVVEVSPPYDTTGATAIAGAHAALEIACLYCWNLRQTRATKT